jgi:hypothetical protein
VARKYSYYPAFDGKGAQPGTEKLNALCAARWKTRNLGIYSARLMRNSHTEGKKIGDPGMEKWLSVHATGAAIDIGYTDRKVGVAMWDWFLANTAALGIEEIHDYAFDANAKDKNKGFVKIFTADDNAGSFGGLWLHVELSPEMAKDAAKFEAAWRALPKPA